MTNYSLYAPAPLKILTAWPAAFADRFENDLFELIRNRLVILDDCREISLIGPKLKPARNHILVISLENWHGLNDAQQKLVQAHISLVILTPLTGENLTVQNWQHLSTSVLTWVKPITTRNLTAFLVQLCTDLTGGQMLLEKAINSAWTQEDDYRLFLARPNGEIWPASTPPASPRKTQNEPPPTDFADLSQFSSQVQIHNSTFGNVIPASGPITINQNFTPPGGTGETASGSHTDLSGPYLIQIFEIVRDYFDEEDLRTICFYLQVNYDSLPARGMSGKARELIKHLNRNGRIPELVAYIKKKRPKLDMDFPEA